MTNLGFLQGFLRNYEVAKLHIDHPFFLDGLIYITVLFVTLLTLERKFSTLLDFSQTQQLRGLAMLFVIVGHFWLHICRENGPFFYFADYAVSLFLLISGYGLMSSNMAHRVTARVFLTKRIRKILVPYWLVTLGFLVVDYILRQKTYPLYDLLLTFIGINFSKTLQYIDYFSWFITLLLIYYLIFFICAKLWRPRYATMAILFFSLALLALRHYEIFPLGARHQLLAFPLGCLLAVLKPIIRWDMANIQCRIGLTLLIIPAMVSIYLIGLSYPDNTYMKYAMIYLYSYVQPYLFCLLCILSISFLASAGYISRFLSLCGYLSYELYLIHGALLVKYNPIIGNFGNEFILLEFFIWFGITLGFAYILKVGTSLVVRTAPIPERLR